MNGEQLGESQNAFMGRVRQALAADVHKTARPDGIGLARLVDPTDDLVGRFIHTAAAAGMLVERTTSALANSVIARLLKHHGGGRVLVSVSSRSVLAMLVEAAAAAGTTMVEPGREEPRGGLWRAFTADIGLTDVVFAVAETGSIGLASSAGRGAYLATPVHLAVVRASQIAADLIDIVARLDELARSDASITIVSGPSKTADIEGVLITGVHGPGVVQIVVISDE